MRTGALPVVVICALGLPASPTVPAGAAASSVGSDRPARVLSAVPLSACVHPDNGDPELTSLAILTPTVSTANGDARVQVRVTVVDTGGPGAASGIDRITVLASKRNSRQTPRATLTQALDGSWTGGLLVRRGARPGVDWKIHYLDMYDKAGNYRQYLTDDFAAAGFHTGFTVLGPIDETAPRLDALRLSTLSPDVTRGAATLRIRAAASDDLGVRLVHLLMRETTRGRQHTDVWLTRTAGTARDGIWTGKLRIPRFAQAGRWNLEMRVTDNVRRVRTLGVRELAATGFPSHVTVTSRTDTDRAKVAQVIAVRNIDVRTQPVDLTVRIRATDQRSGVARMHVSLWPPTDAFTQALPSDGARLIAGTRRDGTWTATLHVSDCLAWPGDWSLRIFMWDRVGNRTISDPGTVHITAKEHYFRPPTVRPNLVPPAGPVTLAFERDVTGISSSTVTVLPSGYQRFSAAEPPPAVAGTWACRDAAGTPVACDTGALRNATFTPSASFSPNSGYDMWPNLEHTWAVTDLNGNPASGTWSFITAP